MKRELFASLFLATACVVGCDDKKTDTMTPATPANTGSTVDRAADKTGAAMDNAADKTGGAMDKAGGMMDKAADKAVNATDKAAGAMSTDATEAQSQAATLMQQVQTYIAEKKWSDADAAIVKLEALKPKLSAPLASSIDQLKASVAQMKSMGGQTPAMPK